MSTQTRPATNVPAKAPDNTPPAIKQVHGLFLTHRKAIEDALPKHLTAERMMRIALTELRKTPKLQQCDPLSFLGAIVQSCQLGLEPGGALGHCYLIPYGRDCQLQIGYRGMVDLSRRSGNIVSISARCVYAGDDFAFGLGTDEFIKHTPRFQTTEITHVYAVAKLKDGGVQFEIMSVGEVNHIRDTYSSGFKRDAKTSPWTTAYDEMAKKTAVRRLFKMLPTSVEIRDAIRVDEDDDQRNAKIIDPEYEVLPAAPDPEKLRALHGDTSETPPHAGNKAAMDADRKLAIEEFSSTVNSLMEVHDVTKLLGRSPAEVLKGDAKSIQAATDLLVAKTKP